jgi:hydrogenase maturation protein HypF
MSQHIGDMQNWETLAHFEHMLFLYKDLFRFKPKFVAHDMHPDYYSTRYAEKLKADENGIILIPIQHHHAHIVSCIAENEIKPPAIGIAFDGTGYGLDGAIWGGEFLLSDYTSMRRLAHLEYIPIPGGDASIKKPYRMAISYLQTLLGENVFHEKLKFLESIEKFEIDLIKTQIKKRINSPVTSSAGRLFDAVSAIAGVRNEIDYEAQAAIEFEMIGSETHYKGDLYPFQITAQNGIKTVLLRDLFLNIIYDIKNNMPKSEISAKFHHSIASMISHMCKILCLETGINQVALSGGVFQNRLLLRLTLKYLEKTDLNVFFHREVPCNDGGVSLGQAVIANCRIRQ